MYLRIIEYNLIRTIWIKEDNVTLEYSDKRTISIDITKLYLFSLNHISSSHVGLFNHKLIVSFLQDEILSLKDLKFILASE